jgi:isocitrate/isopropylmalate dehydrogenase
MKIPEVRAEIAMINSRLMEINREMQDAIERLDALTKELVRRPPVNVAPRSSTRMTSALRQQIKAYATANPCKTHSDIGRMFNVNPGRVSEAVRGKRQ